MRVRSLTCPKCGGRTRISHGMPEGLCIHCGNPVKVSQAVLEEQAQAWAFPAATPVRLGMKARFRDREFEVWGRQVLRQTDDEGTVYQWEEFVLVAPDGDLIYLEYDEGKWKISEPYVPQAPIPHQQLTGAREGSFVSIDNHSTLVSDAGVSTITYAEGEFPWLVTIGQQKGFLDAAAKDGFYSVEWTRDAIEYYRGQFLDERHVFSIFGWRHLLVALEQREGKVRSQKIFGGVCFALSLVALIFWGMALGGSGRPVPGGSGTVMVKPNDQEGTRFGPIKLTAKDRVHRLEIRGHMREQSNWVQAVIEDENEVELFQAQRDMWDESGYDSDGAWHESDLSASTDFLVKTPGNYYVRLYTEPDPANRSSGMAMASFTIRQEVLYPVYLGIFGFVMLAVGIIWLCRGASVASGRIWTQVPDPSAKQGGTS